MRQGFPGNGVASSESGAAGFPGGLPELLPFFGAEGGFDGVETDVREPEAVALGAEGEAGVALVHAEGNCGAVEGLG